MPQDPLYTLFPISVIIQRTAGNNTTEEKLDWWKLKGKSNQQKALGLILGLLKEEGLPTQ